MTESKSPASTEIPIAAIAQNHGIRQRAFAYPDDHPVVRQWLDGATGLLPRLRAWMQEHAAHPARTVVFLPYAQLLPLAQRMWQRLAHDEPASFCPRFETTSNWLQQMGLQRQEWSALDIRFDPGLDYLAAQALLVRAKLPDDDHMIAALLEAVMQLAPLAAACPPERRTAWAQQARQAVQSDALMTSAPLRYEQALVSLAVEWAALSGYDSDGLWEPDWLQDWDAVLWVQGLGGEQLASALQGQWQDWCKSGRTRCVSAVFGLVGAAKPMPAQSLRLLACADAEDEAQHTAACLLEHIAQDRYPVAWVSSDRAMTRRVRALLEAVGVQMRDETGWKLSTSYPAAAVMALLRAAHWGAESDAVLAFAKQMPRWQTPDGTAEQGVDALESWLRSRRVRSWHQAQRTLQQDSPQATQAKAQWQAVDAVRQCLGGRHVLGQWLGLLQQALQAAGAWEAWSVDPLGQSVLQALRLLPAQPGDGSDWAVSQDQALWAQRKFDLSEFQRWVQQTLEGASYQPPYPWQEEVVILPMSQLLARPFAAVVLSGCDAMRLNPSPELRGAFTRQQREALGLPSREVLQVQLAQAWQQALQGPHCDVLWRTVDDAGEVLQASALVLALQTSETPGLRDTHLSAADLLTERRLHAAPTLPTEPTGQALVVAGDFPLSASAYDDLRTCPYRFFAQRLLGLQEAEELDAEADKRDYGQWLHAVLQRFHDGLRGVPESEQADAVALSVRLDAACEAVLGEQTWNPSELLPWRAAWPSLRGHYLAWWTQHRLTADYEQGEAAFRRHLPINPVQGGVALQLRGRIDRIDRIAGAGGVGGMPNAPSAALLLDYKTESLQKTKARVKDPLEDTQLPFYAALYADPRVGDTRSESINDVPIEAAYLNINEREGIQLVAQPALAQAHRALVEGIVSDMERIAAGHGMPALGEGDACEYCRVRGLCRKDFWSAA